MRARNLKPSIFKNEGLAKLGPWHHILFTGLWCIADREGRLEDRPERIEAEIFPFKFQNVDVDGMLSDLSNCDQHFTTRYIKNGKPYIQVNNFKGHQYPHHRESESLIPSPGKAQGQTRELPKQAHLNPESPILNPESISPAQKSAVGELIELFFTKLTEKLGEKPAAFNGGVLGKLFKTVLKSQTVDEVKRRIEAWFASTETFIQTNGYSPTLFAQRYSLLKGGPIHAGRNSISPHVKLTQADQNRRDAYAN